MWELAAVGCLLLFIAGVAMRKTRKPSEFATFGGGDRSSVNTDELARKIAKEMGKEFRTVMQEFRDDLRTITIGRVGRNTSIGGAGMAPVEIDESVIPTNLKMNVEATNLDGATKEQKVVDKGLGKSKSKLAALRKKKEK